MSRLKQNVIVNWYVAIAGKLPSPPERRVQALFVNSIRPALRRTSA